MRGGALAALFLLAACDETEIESASLRNAGVALGKTTVSLMTAPVSTDAKGMRERLGAVAADLAALALGFDALGRAPGVLPDGARPPLVPSGEPDLLSWNGKRLEARLEGVPPGATRLVADLRYEGYRHETVEPGSDPCWWGERAGDGSVQCPAIILHTLEFTRPGEGLTVHARFGVTLDGDECAAGGQVEIDYAIRNGESSRGGSLRSTYNGCGRIRIMTSN